MKVILFVIVISYYTYLYPAAFAFIIVFVSGENEITLNFLLYLFLRVQQHNV